MRPCLTCGTPTPATRCPNCRRLKDRARGSRQARGYDTPYDRARRTWKPIVATGTVRCGAPNCGQLIAAGEPFDLGHPEDRSLPPRPWHQRCNRATARRRTPPSTT